MPGHGGFGRRWSVLALLGAGLEAAAEAADNEGLSYPVQAACAAAFGLAAIWLLGAAWRDAAGR